MRVYDRFAYSGSVQYWAVPEDVETALFECWGAGGGQASSLHEGSGGGSAPANTYFTNQPGNDGQLGRSFSNNAGYVAGERAVTPGETYHVYVGGNGGPGYSTINGTRAGLRGGSGGYNGGGEGAAGAYVTQNLYNSQIAWSDYTYHSAASPSAAKKGQKWLNSATETLWECTLTYSKTHSKPVLSYWTELTHQHMPAAGPSGGGGGGATDVRYGGDNLSDRIMVAGGSGGGAGSYHTTGVARQTLHRVPASPAPPFGVDGAGGATGPDDTYDSVISYTTGGWGAGGLGGAGGSVSNGSTALGGGSATWGGAGGVATSQHAVGKPAPSLPGSGGNGGTNDAGGAGGADPGNTSQGGAGSRGQGGNGATPQGGHNDWCAGGGGGGGGFYGGGGGGAGFRTSTAMSSEVSTCGGGGGGGSNYLTTGFTNPVLAGCARPPAGATSKATGANGRGGFARVSYAKPPSAQWLSVPQAVVGGETFNASFTYIPAVDGGAGIGHYVVGSGPAGDDVPTLTRTIMVPNPTQTEFSAEFTAPGDGVSAAIFVQVIDTDGDDSVWIKQQISGVPVVDTTAAVITSPAPGSAFMGSATVKWTLGVQTPLVAYRLGVRGKGLVDGTDRGASTGLRRGGSRVNFATDPGFKGSSVWSSTSNTALAADTAHPGVSGSDGKITWALADSGAENHTTAWDNLAVGVTYRLHIDIASNTPNDFRPYEFQVWDSQGPLTSYDVDLSGVAAGVYVSSDISFTPTAQGVYVVLVPSSPAKDDVVGALVSIDFEGDTISPFAAGTVDSTNPNSGTYCLSVNAAAASTTDVSASLNGAGNYVLEVWAYSPAASARVAQIAVAGTGVVAAEYANDTTRDAWCKLRLPFTYSGAGTILLYTYGDATNPVLYDDITVWAASGPNFGATDDQQITYLANMLVEAIYDEDSDGYQDYFDGSHVNGLAGTVSWSGATNASPTYLTGTDVLTGDVAYSGATLTEGALYLDTVSESAALSGFGAVEVSEYVRVNPSLPSTPTVLMSVNSVGGVVVLTLNAADSTSEHPTISFDIFRDGTRIVTGLVPDGTTRKATYTDTPATGDMVSYLVRAFDAEGGYVDQTNGTVTLLD